MKYSNEMAIHIWANQSETQGENKNGSIFFERNTIYSYGYHFAMAKIFDSITLVNSSSYSATTGKQLAKVRQSINGNFIAVPNVNIAEKGDYRYNKKEVIKLHKENRLYLIEQATQALLRSTRARKSKDYLVTLAVDCQNEVNDYTEAFSLRYKAFQLPNAKELLEKDKKARKALKIEKVKREKARLLELADKIAEWRKGGLNQYFSNVPVMMRLSDDKETLQTSQGADVPSKFLKPIWRQVKNCIKTKTNWKPNGHALNVGHFSIDSINKNGDLKAGCHNIKFAEVERMSKLMGF